MDALQVVLQPIGELGPNVSASVYKLPASIKGELIAGILAQEPQLKAMIAAGQAKVNGIRSEGGEGLLAIGGFMEPELFEKVHGVLMSMDGVELVIGAGPGCSTLPRTSLGNAAAGAYARSKAAKPWWKVW